MTPKEKAKELVRQFYSVGANECKQCALIAIQNEINFLNLILNDSIKIHQSNTTPKKLCIDILNPLLKEKLEVKIEIEKL